MGLEQQITKILSSIIYWVIIQICMLLRKLGGKSLLIIPGEKEKIEENPREFSTYGHLIIYYIREHHQRNRRRF